MAAADLGRKKDYIIPLSSKKLIPYIDAANKVPGGFKLFFNEDKPCLMTPKQVLGLESVNGVKMKEMPKFINYQ